MNAFGYQANVLEERGEGRKVSALCPEPDGKDF